MKKINYRVAPRGGEISKHSKQNNEENQLQQGGKVMVHHQMG